MYSTVVVVILSVMTACGKSQPLDEAACEFKDNTTLQNNFYKMVRGTHGVYESGELNLWLSRSNPPHQTKSRDIPRAA